jgi:hypothetical protein
MLIALLRYQPLEWLQKQLLKENMDKRTELTNKAHTNDPSDAFL